MAAKLRKKLVKNNGFWKINAIRPVIKARWGKTGKFKFGLKANWERMAHLSPLVHCPFLIAQTAIFCIAMNAKRNTSLQPLFKKGVRNMRSTFNILF